MKNKTPYFLYAMLFFILAEVKKEPILSLILYIIALILTAVSIGSKVEK